MGLSFYYLINGILESLSLLIKYRKHGESSEISASHTEPFVQPNVIKHLRVQHAPDSRNVEKGKRREKKPIRMAFSEIEVTVN